MQLLDLLPAPICPVCLRAMVPKQTEGRRWWSCVNYPGCDYTCGEHPGGGRASTPAGQPLKRLRQRAHRLMEAIWGKHTKNAYRWLKAHSDQGHIGWMDEGEVKAVIVQLEELLHG